MNTLVPITLFGWLPLVLVIFSLLPPRRAVIAAFISAWLFLPMAGYQIPAFPDYTKRTATSLAVLLGMALFHSDLLFALRPRWFDLPIVIYCCFCPIASSLSNGLGFYDGCSVALIASVTWGLPYLIGRVYFTRLEHLRELAVGIFIGGIACVPLCWWEMRMSPQLHYTLYGFQNGGWGEMSFGGYRPKLFLSCALELGLWMTATATTGFWLWASGSVKKLYGFPSGWFVLALIATAILCKVTGAVIILILGLSVWSLLKWSGSRLPAVGLILVPVLYIATRTSANWTGDQAVDLIRMIVNDRRAQSLEFRMKNENLLAAHALRQPWFGWGGWGRNFVTDRYGRALTTVDGMWIIALGTHGLTGLISFESALLLPMVILVRRYPVRTWRTPTLAPAAVLAILANLYTIDCIANAMVNPIYYLALGGVTGTLGAMARPRMSSQLQPGGADLSELLDHLQDSTSSRTLPGGTGHLDGPDPREEAAVRFGSLGRSLMEHGMAREAEEAWSSARRLWAELAADYPDDLEYRKCWLDGLNDSAWTLIARPGIDDRTLASTIQLAEQTVTLEPESATYWNTLGIAYFRARDWKAAIHALGQSTELGDGGTSFDFFFLAMAWWQQGNREQAHHWYLRGNVWMEEHNPDHEALVRFREEAIALLDSRPIPV
jgi:tetratricopeptide (TPR) repeat protein